MDACVVGGWTPGTPELVVYWYVRRKRQQINKYKIKEKQKRAAWADIGMAQADIPVAKPT